MVNRRISFISHFARPTTHHNSLWLRQKMSLEGFGGHHWRSDRLSIGLGGDFAAVEGTTGPITDAFPWLMKVDLLHLQERWSAIYWTAEMKEQIPQPDPRLMMVVTAHLSSVGEHGNDEQHHGVSRPHTTSHPVDFAQFPFAILTCPTQMVLFLLYPLFSRDPDRQYLCCNTELVATCATQDCLGTARRL